MSNRTLTLGAAQVAEVYLDTPATVRKDIEYIHRAGDQDLDLLVFPEYHIGGSPRWHKYDDRMDWEEYYVELFDNAITVPGPEIERLGNAAREAGTAIVMGINEKEADTAGTLYNSLVFIDTDGTLLGVRRKLVPTAQERLFHTGGSGDGLRTFDSRIGTLGGLICSEHQNPLAIFSILAQNEEIHAATWPAFPTRSRDTRGTRMHVRARYHAFVGNVPTVSAAGVVNEELADVLNHPEIGLDSGGSAIISPEAEFLAGPVWEGEEIVAAEVDLRNRTLTKAKHDIIGHYNRFDIFTLEIDRERQTPLRFNSGARGEDAVQYRSDHVAEGEEKEMSSDSDLDG